MDEMPRNLNTDVFIRNSFERCMIRCSIDKRHSFYTSFAVPSRIGREKKMKLLKQRATLELIDYLKNHGVSSINIVTRGPLVCGEFIDFDMLETFGIHLGYIKDMTPIPHHGIRPPAWKRKRLEKENSSW